MILSFLTINEIDFVKWNLSRQTETDTDSKHRQTSRHKKDSDRKHTYEQIDTKLLR